MSRLFAFGWHLSGSLMKTCPATIPSMPFRIKVLLGMFKERTPDTAKILGRLDTGQEPADSPLVSGWDGEGDRVGAAPVTNFEADPTIIE